MSVHYKTPLRYPGGKSKVAGQLVSLFPSFSEYREPFLGGGSVFLETKSIYPDKVYKVNDLYYDLFCFWKIVQEQTEHLIYRIKDMYPRNSCDKDYGKALYDECIKGLSGDCSEIDRAVYFFIINRITFSGTSLSGGYSQESFEKRFTESSIERIRYCSWAFRKGNVDISCDDYSALLSEPGDDVFIFLDPPYYSATDSALYGKNGELHKGFDHERFRECVGNCKHKWMITYDDCEYIRDLYKDFNIRPFEFSYGMRNVTEDADMKGKELIITNYDIKEQKETTLF